MQTGAYVGGTGTVQRVTIEQGGGFTAAPGQARALAGATWRVMLNGAAVPHGYVGSVDIRDGVVYGVVGRGGTCVIFR